MEESRRALLRGRDLLADAIFVGAKGAASIYDAIRLPNDTALANTQKLGREHKRAEAVGDRLEHLEPTRPRPRPPWHEATAGWRAHHDGTTIDLHHRGPSHEQQARKQHPAAARV